MVILVMAGCQSKRNLTVTSSSVETVQTALSADGSHTSSRDMWRKLVAACDSLGIKFTADSVRTPEGGVIYHPDVTATAMSPTMAVEAAEKETETY